MMADQTGFEHGNTNRHYIWTNDLSTVREKYVVGGDSSERWEGPSENVWMDEKFIVSSSSASLAPSDEETSLQSGIVADTDNDDEIKIRENRNIASGSQRRHFLGQWKDVHVPVDLNVSDSSYSEKISFDADEESMSSSVNVAPSDEEKCPHEESMRSRYDEIMTHQSESTRSKYDCHNSIIDDDNDDDEDAREARLHSWVRHYSSYKPRWEKCGGEEEEQSTIERGEEVTYREFVVVGDRVPTTKIADHRKGLVPRHRLHVGSFKPFLVRNDNNDSNNIKAQTVPSQQQHEDVSESEEELCDYDYYFSQDTTTTTPTSDTQQATETLQDTKTEKRHVSKKPHERMIHAGTSSDTSYSSDESSIAADPVDGWGCPDLTQRFCCEPATPPTQGSIIIRGSDEKSHDDNEDAYCSFLLPSASVPSKDEEGVEGEEDDDDDLKTTSLCTWNDIQYFSVLFLTYAGKMMPHDGSSTKERNAPRNI